MGPGVLFRNFRNMFSLILERGKERESEEKGDGERETPMMHLTWDQTHNLGNTQPTDPRGPGILYPLFKTRSVKI